MAYMSFLETLMNIYIRLIAYSILHIIISKTDQGMLKLVWKILLKIFWYIEKSFELHFKNTLIFQNCQKKVHFPMLHIEKLEWLEFVETKSFLSLNDLTFRNAWADDACNIITTYLQRFLGNKNAIVLPKN